MFAHAYAYTHTHTLIYTGGTCGVTIIIEENGHSHRVQIPDETVCISHSANALGKSVHATIVPPAKGK